MTDPTPIKRPRGRPRKVRPGEAMPVTAESEGLLPGDKRDIEWTDEGPVFVEPAVGAVIAGGGGSSGNAATLYVEPASLRVIGSGGGNSGGRIIQVEDGKTTKVYVGGEAESGAPQEPKAAPFAALTELQVTAYTRDAMDAYMGQHEVKRADGWNRIWSFRHEIVRNHDTMLVRCDRGPIVAERFIPTSQMTFARAEEAVRDVDRETGRGNG